MALSVNSVKKAGKGTICGTLIKMEDGLAYIQN
jgi:hypothetical protein